MPYVIVWCRAVMVGVFLVSTVTKLSGRTAPAALVSWVESLRLLPRGWSRPVAYAGVTAELGAAILTAVPATVPLGLGCGAALLAVFTASIAAALRRGGRVPCRCFGSSTTPMGWPHVARNLTLIAVCATGLVATAVATAPARHPVGVITALVGAAAAVLLVVQFDDLVALLASQDTSSRSG